MREITITTYHVFADNVDYWFDNYDEAKEAYDHLGKDGYDNRRIYRETSTENSDEVDEEYVIGTGDFPW